MNTTTMEKTWSLAEALPLIKVIEAMCPQYGCHVALTGGVLYGDGERKDLDLLFYRIRQETLNHEGLEEGLANLGIIVTRKNAWVWKAKYFVKNLDLFFPEKAGAGPEEYR